MEDIIPKCSSNKPTLVCTFWLAKSFSSGVSCSLVPHRLRAVTICRWGSEKQNLRKQEQIVVAFPHEQNVVQQPSTKIWCYEYLGNVCDIYWTYMFGSLQKLCLNSSAANSWLRYLGLDQRVSQRCTPTLLKSEANSICHDN